MKHLFTFLFLSFLAISVQAQCTINFNPNQSGDELEIDGQGVNQTITQTTDLNFDGNGAITFTYSGSNGSSFSYDCGSIQFNSGPINDGFQHFESSPLPVELTFFKLEIINNSVALKWQTSTEKNNEGFEIQHSMDGIHYEYIGFVQGNGTTLEVQDYIFIDFPRNGMNYYRLKQIDFDGGFEYSNVVYANFDNENTARMYGNVAENTLRLSGEGNALIVNSFGQVVKQIHLTESNIATINVSEFGKGIYYVKLKNETLRFVKI